ncbi:MAG TPA: hypothetical protein VOA41_19630 [Candidatus Dormibacteraeota bacterium]|nr:hypothetical protein [Candidatus Dormibacteraeota bacterium]
MPMVVEATSPRARIASPEEIPLLVETARADILPALLENPRLDESHICLLLRRLDLSGELLQQIARRRAFMSVYRVKRAMAFHPHAPRLVVMRLARELYLMDLVQLSRQPGVPAELRRVADNILVARLPQLPLGQKITLARRASARVAGALLAEGHARIVPIALDNAFLNEAQVLKVLAHDKLPPVVVSAIAHHEKWSKVYNVRLALVRHAAAPLSIVLAVLPDLAACDLEGLGTYSALPANLRRYIEREVQRRIAALPAKPKEGS